MGQFIIQEDEFLQWFFIEFAFIITFIITDWSNIFRFQLPSNPIPLTFIFPISLAFLVRYWEATFLKIVLIVSVFTHWSIFTTIVSWITATLYGPLLSLKSLMILKFRHLSGNLDIVCYVSISIASGISLLSTHYVRSSTVQLLSGQFSLLLPIKSSQAVFPWKNNDFSVNQIVAVQFGTIPTYYLRYY